MKKYFPEQVLTKAEKRQLKKRPRMPVHGAALKKFGRHAGKKLSKR